LPKHRRRMRSGDGAWARRGVRVTYLAVTGLSQSHGRRRGPGHRDEGNLGAIGIIELAVGDWNPEAAPQTAIQCGGTKSIDQPRGPAGSDHSRRLPSPGRSTHRLRYEANSGLGRRTLPPMIGCLPSQPCPWPYLELAHMRARQVCGAADPSVRNRRDPERRGQGPRPSRGQRVRRRLRHRVAQGGRQDHRQPRSAAGLLRLPPPSTESTCAPPTRSSPPSPPCFASEAVNAPHLVPLVRSGAIFKNGKLITRLIPPA
jgi:hypothetical protein